MCLELHLSVIEAPHSSTAFCFLCTMMSISSLQANQEPQYLMCDCRQSGNCAGTEAPYGAVPYAEKAMLDP